MRKNLNKIFFGIAVVAAGIIFLGSAFGFWEIGELSGWWTVFIIVPAIGSMIASGLDLLNVAAVAVGVWLLLKCNPQWVPAERMNHFAIAIALVAVGFWLIFSTVKTKKLKKHLDDNSDPFRRKASPLIQRSARAAFIRTRPATCSVFTASLSSAVLKLI